MISFLLLVGSKYSFHNLCLCVAHFFEMLLLQYLYAMDSHTRKRNRGFSIVSKQSSMYFLGMPDCPDHLSKLIGNKLQSIANDPQYPASSPCASPYAELYASKSTMMRSPTVRLLTSLTLTLIYLIAFSESLASTLQ